ncbi:MAG: hypothetical protein H0X29_00065 [Parachlamydiaceae bacterium]|nr:hypothetical protein [Parachlamydiaceae bacterium]
MTAYARVLARSVGSYHLNNSLLFQFILSDFLAAYLDIQSLDILCHRKLLPVVEKTYSEHNEELIHKIAEVLERLIGTKNDHIKRFSSNINEGILTRFKMHCSKFSHQSEGDTKELLAMQHYAEKAFQNCLLAVDALQDAPNKYTQLFTYLEKASTALHRLGKLITRLILQFRDDENVLFFVLRHKDSFDKAFGKRFISKLFCRMYPKGLREAEHFLIRKYMDRSFDNITLIITRLFVELEASNL